MITRITYNCNRESLGDVSESAFADAIENEIVALPVFRNVFVEVRFSDSESGVVGYHYADQDSAELNETISECAGKAFRHCLNNAA